MRSKLEGEEQPGAEALTSEAMSLRQKVLDELAAELPAVVLVFMFDLLTGAVYARKAGKSASALRVGLLAEKAQPTELIGAALSRVVRSYASRLSPARGTVSSS